MGYVTRGPAGAPGAPGAPGADGAPGVNAFTLTTDLYIHPNPLETNFIEVEETAWMAVGQPLIVSGESHDPDFPLDPGVPIQAKIRVVDTAGTLLEFDADGFAGNPAGGTNFKPGAKVSPCGEDGAANAAGTANKLAKFTGATTLGDSNVADNGAEVSVAVPLSAATINGATVNASLVDSAGSMTLRAKGAGDRCDIRSRLADGPGTAVLIVGEVARSAGYYCQIGSGEFVFVPVGGVTPSGRYDGPTFDIDATVKAGDFNAALQTLHMVDLSGSDITPTLPAASAANAGKELLIVQSVAGTANLILTPASGVIEGTSSLTLAGSAVRPYLAVRLVSCGVGAGSPGWKVI